MSQTLEKLMDEAESGIRSRGYHAVSFRDLATALGIKSASVHYYFRQKEDLGVALVKRYSERFFEALNARAETEDNKLKAFAAIYREALVGSDSICLCGMLGAESCGLPEVLNTEVSEFFIANIAWIAGNLPGEMPAGERQSKAEVTLSTLQGAMMVAETLKDHAIFDRAVEEVLR